MKTEKEKMLAGEPYIAVDVELAEINSKAQALLYEFNNSHPSESNLRRSIVQNLFGQIGSNFEIKQPFYCDYGENIRAGENLFINYDCVILDCNEVRIGNNVLIAPKVQIYTAYHPLDGEIRKTLIEMAAPVFIGDDVWIGGGVIVCPGVKIGAGTTIGAGSVVTKDIPEKVLAAGNPCRVIRNL